jgi:hypothetical protein
LRRDFDHAARSTAFLHDPFEGLQRDTPRRACGDYGLLHFTFIVDRAARGDQIDACAQREVAAAQGNPEANGP